MCVVSFGFDDREEAVLLQQVPGGRHPHHAAAAVRDEVDLGAGGLVRLEGANRGFIWRYLWIFIITMD